MSLLWRSLRPGDAAALRGVQARQNAAVGMATPFPDLNDGGIRWARVALKDGREVVGAVLAVQVYEIWYIADRAATLRAALAEAPQWAQELAERGIGEVRIALHRARLRPLERLLGRRGWRRSNPECVEFFLAVKP